MKKYVCFVTVVLLFSGSLLFAGEFEVGASVGANLWGDTVGLAVTPEARWLFGDSEKRLVFGAGAAVRYNLARMEGYTQNELGVLALASADYALIPKLSVRGQVGLGGGWLGASGGEVVSVGALIVHPLAGLQYDLGLLRLHVLSGSAVTFVSGGSKNTITIDVGATYRFKTVSKKVGVIDE